MIDHFAKHLHSDLREVRETMVWKREGLGEYDVRRPPTSTGTNLLGLIKHLSTTEAWYFGDVFGARSLHDGPGGTNPPAHLDDMWAAADKSRDEILDRYRRAWEHSDATIAALDIDAPGHVPRLPRPEVKLFNILVYVLTETNRHEGHADVLREQLDGAVGTAAGSTPLPGRDTAFWEHHWAKIEQADKAADPASDWRVRSSSTTSADDSTDTRPGGSCGASPDEPGSPSESGRTHCATPSSPQLVWTPASRYATCKKQPATPTRAPRCATTVAASPSTGTPPTSPPRSSRHITLTPATSCGTHTKGVPHGGQPERRCDRTVR